MMNTTMLPIAIAKVLEAHAQEHAELTDDLRQVSILAQDEVASQQSVRLILLQDEQGPVQVIFPSQALVDIDRLNRGLERSLAILPQAKYQERLTRLQLQAIPAIPALTGLPVVADESLQQLESVILETGQAGQWLKMIGELIRSLLAGNKWQEFSNRQHRIPNNRNHSQRQLDQLNTAISKSTLLRIQQRLEDALEMPLLPDTAQR